MVNLFAVSQEHGVDITAEEVLLYFSSKVRIEEFPFINKENIKNGKESRRTVPLLQDRDKDGKISYDEFCDRKTLTEKAFEVRLYCTLSQR